MKKNPPKQKLLPPLITRLTEETLGSVVQRWLRRIVQVQLLALSQPHHCEQSAYNETHCQFAGTNFYIWTRDDAQDIFLKLLADNL